MGKIVVTEFVSLDGVFEAPGPDSDFEHAGWTFTFDRGENTFKFDELMAADAQLLGRITYEHFAAAWPNMQGTGEFGEKMNSMPKYVVSRTLDSADWENSTVLRGALAEEVPALRERHSGDILVAGSGQLVRGLLAEGLVDEIRLLVFPIVLGSGKRLFAEGTAKTRFRLLESFPVGADGILITRYATAEEPENQPPPTFAGAPRAD
jgi:dihydrofolate reductase